MSEDDDTETHGENMDAEQQIDSTLLKLAERRAAIDRKRKDLNEEAREIAANCEKIGVVPGAFNLAIRLVKGMDPGERRDYLNSVRRVTKVTGERQGVLWPEETNRQVKREEDRKRKAAEEKSAAGRSPDHPRSDPAKGGAGKKRPAKGKTPAEATAAGAAASDAALAAAIAKNHDAEQAEGDVILGDGIPSVAS